MSFYILLLWLWRKCFLFLVLNAALQWHDVVFWTYQTVQLVLQSGQTIFYFFSFCWFSSFSLFLPSPHSTFIHRPPALSDIDIPLEMGVYSCSSPQQAESTRADTPTQEIVSSSQSTPPPKRNKVGAHEWGWTAVNDRSYNCLLKILIIVQFLT